MTSLLTEKQKTRLLRLARVADVGELGLITEVNALDEKINTVETKLDSKILSVEQNLSGKIENALAAVIDGEKGDPGEDYVLTDADKNEIASKITVPVVEKIIQKTEVIREIPIVTEVVKETVKESSLTPEQQRDALESLQGNERLDKSAVKGIDEIETKLSEVEKKAKNVQVIGGQRGMQVYVDGAKKGLIQSLNIKAGSGVSLAYSKTNGLETLTISASGGSSSALKNQTVTGTIDGTTTAFTIAASFTSKSFIVLNGQLMAENTDYTVSGTLVTYVTAPNADLVGTTHVIFYTA